MTSQTSGPYASAARRPDGPSLKITPGWSAIRRPSSMSRCASPAALAPGHGIGALPQPGQQRLA